MNLFLAFLTPKFDPALEDSLDNGGDAGEGPSLPMKGNDEFRPFIRRLPEFKFWYAHSGDLGGRSKLTFVEYFQVFGDESDPYRVLLYVFQNVRHTRVLAYSPVSFAE